MKHAFEFSGFGVFASIDFSSGDFLLEYVGEKITPHEAEQRQKSFHGNKIFYYKFQEKTWW